MTELAHLGEILSFENRPHFGKAVFKGSKREVIKSFPFARMAEKHKGAPIHFNNEMNCV